MIQEFARWWFVNVFDPYANFVFVENLGWATIIVTIVTAVLLGVFYKPGDPFYYGWFMEHYGFPMLIIFFAGLCLPVFSVILMLVMPGLLALAALIAVTFGLYLLVQRWREDYEDQLREEIHRLEQQRREER